MTKKSYLDSLPKKQMAAGALLFNKEGELLILHPTYKNRWEIPGGVIEHNESPKEALEREIKEELGISLNVKEMLICDYWHSQEDRPENLRFIFNGGILTDEQIQQIQLEKKEIKSIEFVSIETDEEKQRLLERKRLGPRIVKALQALNEQQFKYLENASDVD